MNIRHKAMNKTLLIEVLYMLDLDKENTTSDRNNSKCRRDFKSLKKEDFSRIFVKEGGGRTKGENSHQSEVNRHRS